MTQGERLTSEDIDSVHIERYCILSVGFNNGHLVAVDSEIVVRFASDVDESNAVSLALLDVQDIKLDWGSVYRATDTVEDSEVGLGWATTSYKFFCSWMIPISNCKYRGFCSLL